MPMTAEEILKLAEPWTAPISDAAPSGASAKEDERYLSVTTEIAKLDSPSTEKTEWKKVWSTVISQGGELLQEKSKDILIASQVAYAFYRQDNLKGLLKGVALLTVLIENFWPTLFPELKRLKGRAAAVQWFLDKTDIQLKQYAPAPGDRDTLDSLVVALKRLNASAREKYGDSTPSIGKLREMIERLMFDAGPSQEELDAQKAEVEAKAKAEADERARNEAAAKAKADAAAAAAQQAAAAAAQQAAAAPPPVAQPAAPPPVAQPAAPPPAAYAGPAPTVAAPTATTAPPPADVSQVAGWLGGIGTTIAQTGATVRRAADATPLAYRMLRIGLYMHLVDAPPADGAGKTKIPPPAPAVRKQIETIATNQKWAPLIEECESALGASRFCLDFHRFTAQALAGLGDSHAKARVEVVNEVASLLKRLPQLTSMQFSDGTPFADEKTREWISNEVLAGGGGGGGASMSSSVPSGGGPAPVIVVQQGGGGAGEETAVVNEAKKLAAAGKGADAIVMLQSKAATAPSDAARFRYRLGVGQVALAINQVALAKGVFEGLEREVASHNLEAWEPSLAAASAEGLVLCYRALAKGGKPIPPEAGVLYDRVCRLDPATALRIGA
jgi:type VI secretion system protein VasJ